MLAEAEARVSLAHFVNVNVDYELLQICQVTAIKTKLVETVCNLVVF